MAKRGVSLEVLQRLDYCGLTCRVAMTAPDSPIPLRPDGSNGDGSVLRVSSILSNVVGMAELTPNLNIEITGTGPTIVLSHGVGSSASVWNGWVPVLSPNYQVVAWDQPGHGQSMHAEPEAYGPKLAYESLERVIGASSEVILVGHSLGGYLSARFAIANPSRVRALVLVATGPGFRNPEALAKWNSSVRRGAEKQRSPQNLVGLHEDSYVIDHLADLSCPTMVLVGSEDAAFLGATDYIEKKVPGIIRHTIDGAGHMMPETHGAELANIVKNFLQTI
jgi:pimeloyl-ACP methyl ester carboxylesterase